MDVIDSIDLNEDPSMEKYTNLLHFGIRQGWKNNPIKREKV